jgi:hypothetical protein
VFGDKHVTSLETLGIHEPKILSLMNLNLKFEVASGTSNILSLGGGIKEHELRRSQMSQIKKT